MCPEWVLQDWESAKQVIGYAEAGQEGMNVQIGGS